MKVPLELPADEVHLWYTPLAGLDDTARQECLASLDESERQRHTRFISGDAGDQFLVARAALRRCLSLYAPVAPVDWRFDPGEFGKPVVAASHGLDWLSFNVSHTRGMIMCAVCRGWELGIDVEGLDKHCELSLADRFFTRNEAAMIDQAPVESRQDLFLKTWTLKEAVIKALGTGLSCPLSSFDVRIDSDPPQIEFLENLPHDPRLWQLVSFRVGSNFQGAVAVRRPADVQLRLSIRPLPFQWPNEATA